MTDLSTEFNGLCDMMIAQNEVLARAILRIDALEKAVANIGLCMSRIERDLTVQRGHL